MKRNWSIVSYSKGIISELIESLYTRSLYSMLEQLGQDPLSLISMFSETLEMDRVKSDEKKREYYSIISQEANRLSKIVNSMVGYNDNPRGKTVSLRQKQSHQLSHLDTSLDIKARECSISQHCNCNYVTICK